MRNNNPSTLRKLVMSLVVFLLASCGGGTSGTGGVTVDGRVFRPDGSPAENVQVVVVDSGDYAFSDTNGSFQFTNQPKQNLTLLFESDKAQAQTTIQGITNDVKRVSVDCTFDEDRAEAPTDRTEVKERDDDDKNDDKGGDRPDKDDDKNDDDEDKDSDDDSSGSSDDKDDDNDDDNSSGSSGSSDDDEDDKGTDDDEDDDDSAGSSGEGGSDDGDDSDDDDNDDDDDKKDDN